MPPEHTRSAELPDKAVSGGCAFAATAAQLASTELGGLVEVALFVTERPSRGVLAGDTSYWHTARMVRIRWSSATSVVMSQTGNDRQGAVLQVRVQALSPGWFLAHQITVLTGCVTVR